MRYHFGEKIRAIRERRGQTLKDVAEQAGVSESLVSQIERNRVSPALDTLLALVDALDIDLEYLFSDFRKERPVRIVRRSARSSFSRPGVLYERLASIGSAGADQGIDAYIITVEKGRETGQTEYGHPGFELGVVIEGRAELTVGPQSYELQEGDSASFRADVPHLLRNIGEGALRALWIVTPPKAEAGNGGRS